MHFSLETALHEEVAPANKAGDHRYKGVMVRELTVAEQLQVAGGVKTQLGDAIDQAINAYSPTMAQQIDSLPGWTIQFTSGQKSYMEAQSHTIFITDQWRDNMGATLGQLAHELGHAHDETALRYFDITSPTIARDDYIKEAIWGEAVAQTNALKISLEITTTSMGALNLTIPGSADAVQREQTYFNLYNSYTQYTQEQRDNLISRMCYSVYNNFEMVAGGQSYYDFYSSNYTDWRSNVAHLPVIEGGSLALGGTGTVTPPFVAGSSGGNGGSGGTYDHTYDYLLLGPRWTAVSPTVTVYWPR